MGKALVNKEGESMEAVIVLYFASLIRMMVKWEGMNKTGRVVSILLTLFLLVLSLISAIKLISK